MRIGDEEHLHDLVELLVANDVDSSASRRRFDNKAELFVVLLRYRDDIGRH